MGDKVVDQPQKPKPVGDAGYVQAQSATMSGKGILWNNGVGTMPGSEGADVIRGSIGDDIILSGDVSGANGSARDTVENINGKEGYDTAILPGRRVDYQVLPPGPGDYPNIKTWGDETTRFGTVVKLENLESGRIYMLDGVEQVVFDHDQAFTSPKSTLTNLPDRLHDGSTDVASTRELLASMDADDVYEARIAGSRAAAELIDQRYQVGMGVEAAEQMGRDVVSQLTDDKLDVSSLKPPEPEMPKSEFIGRTIQYNGPVNAPKL